MVQALNPNASFSGCMDEFATAYIYTNVVPLKIIEPEDN